MGLRDCASMEIHLVLARRRRRPIQIRATMHQTGTSCIDFFLQFFARRHQLHYLVPKIYSVRCRTSVSTILFTSSLPYAFCEIYGRRLFVGRLFAHNRLLGVEQQETGRVPVALAARGG
jgi:hypothetical protein